MSQDNQMDIHVRFWDSEKSQAEIMHGIGYFAWYYES